MTFLLFSAMNATTYARDQREPPTISHRRGWKARALRGRALAAKEAHAASLGCCVLLRELRKRPGHESRLL